MKTYYENNFATYSLFLDIVYVYYKSKLTITREAARVIVYDRLLFQNDTSYPVLCDITDVYYITQGARTYFALQGSLLAQAIAIVCKTTAKQFMAEYFIRVENPVIETRLFSNESLALDFLEHFKKNVL